MDKEILVVIPYFAAGAQGRELEYAVAGWRNHFLNPHKIIIVGDYHPIVETGKDIEFIECPRVPDPPAGNYRPHIDHVNKFRKVRERFPESQGFIYTCDDIYAVNDFDMVDVLLLKQNSADMSSDRNSYNGWKRDNAKTRDLLVKEGLPTRNWVCHLPVYYEWKKLLEIYEKYDCDHNSYVVEQIYFNTYFRNRIPLQLNLNTDNLKCGIYRTNAEISRLKSMFQNKIWITNGVDGWLPALDRALEEHYKICAMDTSRKASEAAILLPT